MNKRSNSTFKDSPTGKSGRHDLPDREMPIRN